LEDTTIEDVLKTFEDFYIQKDYGNALLTLKKYGQEIPPGLLNYNLGIVYGKIDNWPMARFHFLQSERAGFWSDGLTQNLLLAEQKLEIGKLEKPLSTSDILVKSALFVSNGLLTSLSFMMLLAGLMLLKKKPSVLKSLVIATLVALPVVLNFWINSWPKAVVTESQVIIEGPSQIFTPLGELNPGVMVIVRQEGEWLKIIYPSRFSGWIKNKGLMKLE
jgi:hypothetical protein